MDSVIGARVTQGNRVAFEAATAEMAASADLPEACDEASDRSGGDLAVPESVHRAEAGPPPTSALIEDLP